MPLELHSTFLFVLERLETHCECLNGLTQGRRLLDTGFIVKMVLALWFCNVAEFEIWVRRGR
jgi:hypothetical protein